MRMMYEIYWPFTAQYHLAPVGPTGPACTLNISSNLGSLEMRIATSRVE